MSDLGSVLYEPDRPKSGEHQPIPSQNGTANSNRPSNRRNKQQRHRPPSPIMESPENNMADSGIDESAGTHRRGSDEAGSKPLDNTNMQNADNADQENIRHSLTSEQDFGSNDVLADNDSLESGKIGYTNVVADVTVHTDSNKGNDNTISPDGDASQARRFSDVALLMYKKVHQKHLTDENNGVNSDAANQTSQTMASENVNENISKPVNVDDIDFIDGVKTDKVDSVEARNYGALDRTEALAHASITGAGDNDCSKTSSVLKQTNNGAEQTDLNKNQTKGSVRFKDEGGGEIQDERIIPVRSQPVEGSPQGKKDAAFKRETWASRKLKKTFGLKDKEKYEVEDQPDGKGKLIQLFIIYYAHLRRRGGYCFANVGRSVDQMVSAAYLKYHSSQSLHISHVGG